MYYEDKVLRVRTAKIVRRVANGSTTRGIFTDIPCQIKYGFGESTDSVMSIFLVLLVGGYPQPRTGGTIICRGGED